MANTQDPLVCADCGTFTADPDLEYPGSGVIEVILWLWLVVPGLFYTIWRHQNRKAICHACGSARMIPANSPQGQRLAPNVARGPSRLGKPLPGFSPTQTADTPKGQTPEPTIRFKCQCGKVLVVKAIFAGKTGACKNCGAKMVIPTGSLPETAPSPTPPVPSTEPPFTPPTWDPIPEANRNREGPTVIAQPHIRQPKTSGLVTALLVIVALFLLLVVAAMVIPALAQAPYVGSARWTNDREKLSDLGKAIYAYTQNNNGKLPTTGKPNDGVASLMLLYPDYINTARIFRCSSSDVEPGWPLTENNCSYEYLNTVDPESPANTTIILFDKAGNHDGGRNVLFLDGSVRWMTESEFQAGILAMVEATHGK